MPRPSIANAAGKADPNAKDEFKDLDSDFKDAVAQSSPEDIFKRVTDLQQELAVNQKAKSEDVDLQNIMEQKRTAEEPYRQVTKTVKLKTKYCLRVLGDKGKV